MNIIGICFICKKEIAKGEEGVSPDPIYHLECAIKGSKKYQEIFKGKSEEELTNEEKETKNKIDIFNSIVEIKKNIDNVKLHFGII